MPRECLPQFARYAWLGMCDRMPVRQGCRWFHIRLVNHVVAFARGGACRVRWFHGGHEDKCRVTAGDVSFYPADGEEHTFFLAPEDDFDCFTLLIPPDHLADIARSEVLDPAAAFVPMGPFQDPPLRQSLERIASGGGLGEDASSESRDAAARSLVLRLLHLQGIGNLEWRDDRSVFSTTTMTDLVAYLDAHLDLPPKLADIAAIAGLSPSHFARKFRRSVGMSLERFIIRRRLLRALDMLATNGKPIAEVSLRLGFSSQSHLTRVFSASTGMTPAKYRREHPRPPLPR